MNILIVDDSAQMRRAIKNIVADLVDATYECDDGAAELSIFDKYRPDFVLMDLEMKKKDGLTAMAEIKSAYPAARIIVVSNYDDKELRETARTIGACQYVSKDKLLLLRAILSRSSCS